MYFCQRYNELTYIVVTSIKLNITSNNSIQCNYSSCKHGKPWHVFYIRKRHISVSSFVYKYNQWPHDSHMTGRAGVWEADDIVKFYIALLDFFPATL